MECSRSAKQASQAQQSTAGAAERGRRSAAARLAKAVVVTTTSCGSGSTRDKWLFMTAARRACLASHSLLTAELLDSLRIMRRFWRSRRRCTDFGKTSSTSLDVSSARECTARKRPEVMTSYSTKSSDMPQMMATTPAVIASGVPARPPALLSHASPYLLPCAAADPLRQRWQPAAGSCGRGTGGAHEWGAVHNARRACQVGIVEGRRRIDAHAHQGGAARHVVLLGVPLDACLLAAQRRLRLRHFALVRSVRSSATGPCGATQGLAQPTGSGSTHRQWLNPQAVAHPTGSGSTHRQWLNPQAVAHPQAPWPGAHPGASRLEGYRGRTPGKLGVDAREGRHAS